MKENQITRCASFNILNWKEHFKNYTSIILSIAILHLSMACSYYKVKPVKIENDNQLITQIREFNDTNKYFVLHKNGASYHFVDPVVNESTLELTGEVKNLTSAHLHKKYPETGKTYRYRVENADPLNEIHIYVNNEIHIVLDEKLTIPFSAIDEFAYNNGNIGKSIGNIALGSLGTFVVIMVVYAALKSSCPFVYSKEGDNYVFVGELYPGNIIKNAQRTDYLKLPSPESKNPKYTLQITNELLEIQHTDLAQLIVVEHEKSTQAFNDTEGRIHLIQNPEPPLEIVIDGQKGDLEPLYEKDGDKLLFDTPISTNNSKRTIELTFKKPKHIKDGKLLLTIKNSLWLDYVWGRFNSRFGGYYNTFQKRQQQATREETVSWIKSQNLPLTVSMKKDSIWTVVDEIQSVGPMANRDMVVDFDLSETQKEEIQIKLETGFMFWELDYAAMDFTDVRYINKTIVNPTKAITQDDEEVSHLLTKIDDRYFTQDQMGDMVTIEYEMPSSQEHTKTSVFLKNKGYYTYIRDYKGIPDFTSLKKFRSPGAFTRFSENEYHNVVAPFVKGDKLYTYDNGQ